MSRLLREKEIKNLWIMEGEKKSSRLTTQITWWNDSASYSSVFNISDNEPFSPHDENAVTWEDGNEDEESAREEVPWRKSASRLTWSNLNRAEYATITSLLLYPSRLGIIWTPLPKCKPQSFTCKVFFVTLIVFCRSSGPTKEYMNRFHRSHYEEILCEW